MDFFSLVRLRVSTSRNPSPVSARCVSVEEVCECCVSKHFGRFFPGRNEFQANGGVDELFAVMRCTFFFSRVFF